LGVRGEAPGKQSSFRLGEADREAAAEVRQDFCRAELVLPPLAVVEPDDVASASKPLRFQLVSELGDDVEAPGFCGPQQRGCEPGLDVDRARRYPRLVWPRGRAGGRDVS
jgi:hypothetical protein